MNNINGIGINKCTGCTICEMICPVDAIVIRLNKNGFLEPLVDESLCISCGKCKRVCYKYYETKNKDKSILSSKVYSAWSLDEHTRKSSSSAGIGYEITKNLNEKGYNVIGCIYDGSDNMAKHIVANGLEDLEKISGSKYLQSYFSNIKKIFHKNEKYLIIGTPCQIYGFRKFIELKNISDRFILIDFFCHGVPSYNLWNKYIKDVIGKKVNDVNFRCKKPDWHNFSISINGDSYNEVSDKDPFLKGFLSNLCLGKPCYNCKFRFNTIFSDIRLGDFWGSEYEDNKLGVNIVVTSTEIGEAAFLSLKNNLIFEEKDLDSMIESQYHGDEIFRHPNYKQFCEDLKNNSNLNEDLERALKRSFLKKVVTKINNYVKRVKNG